MTDFIENPPNKNPKNFQPLFFAIAIVIGILLGIKLSSNQPNSKLFSGTNNGGKINELLNYIEQNYVDTISKNGLIEKTISSLLENLDPHSAYIPASELAQTNEMLQGNFDGIGIEFNILNDTIFVVAAVAGGPSEMLGIKAGDRIVKVEKKNVAGVKITNNDVLKMLRGIGGTTVNVSIIRNGNKTLMPFAIKRGKIPLYSVDASYMLNDGQTGVIKIGRFAQTTYNEYIKAFEELKASGMTKMILDLRGNPGGFLNIVSKLCDEFLEDGKLIVYTEGKARKRENYYATASGQFEKSKIAVLIDEGSASASEILAGALQDNDRGIVVGRRSFGKGLVQEQLDFRDGSAMRLTIARYYTPTGRCIQKPYNLGQSEDYELEESQRFKSGELENKDSIKYVDSLKFKTPKGKIVYGGGGITPDIFIPIDTTENSSYLSKVFFTGAINQFCVAYADKNRKQLNTYKNGDDFIKNFIVTDNIVIEFTKYCSSQKIATDEKGLNKSKRIITNQIKALIGRSIYRNNVFYKILSQNDKAISSAVEALK